jgi:predicted transposase YdaD
MNHQKSLIQYWDLKNVSDTSFEEGEKSGIEKGEKIGIEKGELAKAVKVAKEMLLDNEPIDKIVRYTQLSIAQIEALRKY